MLMAKYHATLGESEGILCLSLSPGLVDTSEGKQPPPELMEKIGRMVGKFAKYAPDFKGPITPDESARLCAGVIEEATVEELGGGFISHLGTKRWL